MCRLRSCSVGSSAPNQAVPRRRKHYFKLLAAAFDLEGERDGRCDVDTFLGRGLKGWPSPGP